MSVSLEANAPLVEPSDVTKALANTLIVALWKILSQKTSLNHAWIPDPQKLRNNKCCYFKPLSFRVIYYATKKR